LPCRQTCRERANGSGYCCRAGTQDVGTGCTPREPAVACPIPGKVGRHAPRHGWEQWRQGKGGFTVEGGTPTIRSCLACYPHAPCMVLWVIVLVGLGLLDVA